MTTREKTLSDGFFTCFICNIESTWTLQVRNTSASSKLIITSLDGINASSLSFVFPSKQFWAVIVGAEFDFEFDFHTFALFCNHFHYVDNLL